MKIFLIAGSEHICIAEILKKERKTIIVNKGSLILGETAEYLRENAHAYDKVLITDGALSANPDENKSDLEALLELISAEVVIVTRDFLFGTSNKQVRVFVTPWFRATEEDFTEALQPGIKTPAEKKQDRKIKPGKKPESGMTYPEDAQHEPKRKKLPRIISRRQQEDEEEEEKDLGPGPISLASSKAIVFTGRRGSGITSTAVNIAIAANRRGLNTILVDLDVDYRSINLYFTDFIDQAEKDDAIAFSLVRLLAQPQSYQSAAVNVDGLWLASLGYDFHDKRLLEQHFVEAKIIGLVSSLKHNFDLIVMDFPLDGLAKFPGLLNSVDVFGLCMENNIYSAFTTLRNIDIGFDDRESAPYFASKARLVVTKYNDESMYDDEIVTPEKLSELIVNEELSEDFAAELPVVGSVPYITWFGKQIERDISVMDLDNQMKQAYDGILLRLLGAAR
ncbi:MAG: ParA family protein [Clostridiales bacterium]|jgi:septum formation inhibitor-activating ATPase MinD|nr:ParA family protein [Clostridiales bacterium]